MPVSMTAMSGEVFVEFTTDATVHGAGFVARYSPSADSESSSSFTTPRACNPSTILDTASGVLSDGPGEYGANTECAWSIDAPGAITLTFSEVSLESHYDFVKVYSGRSADGP